MEPVDLTTEPDELEIVEFDPFKATIEALKDKTDFLPDCSTDEGYNKSKTVAKDLQKIRVAVEKVRKVKKKQFLEGGRRVDANAKELFVILDGLQLPHKDAYLAVDHARLKREQDRKDKIEAEIAEITLLPVAMGASESKALLKAITELEDRPGREQDEYTIRMTGVVNKTIKELKELRTAKVAQDKADIETARSERERKAKKKAEREARIRKEERETAERDKKFAVAKEKGKAEAAERREQEAKQEASNAKVRLAKQEKAAEVAKKAAVEQAKQDALDKQERQAQADAKRKREREANEAIRKKIHKAARNCLMDELGVSKKVAKQIVAVIATKKIKNVSIKY